MALQTFGKTTNGSDSTGTSADRKRVSSAVPASAGGIQSMSIRLWLDSAGTSNIRGVIYNDNAGAPGSLFAYTDEVAVSNTTEQEITFNFSGGYLNKVLTSGATYWIGFLNSDPGTPNVMVSRDATANGNRTNADTYSDGPTDPFGSPTSQTGVIDAYVTYDDSITASDFLYPKIITF